MKKFTLRLEIKLYEELLSFSSYIGISLSNLIKIQLALFINRKNIAQDKLEIISIDSYDNNRMNVSIPTEFYDNIKIKADEFDLPTNTFINAVCRYELDNWYSEKL